MSRPLRKLPDPLDDAPRLRRIAAGDPLSELLPRIVVVDDLEHADEAEQAGDLAPDAPREGERRGFQIPASFWWVMVGCYAVFIAALLAATGSSAHAVFMIVISTVYVVMFFGATRLLTREGPAQPRSPLARPGGSLPTLYGLLRRREVAAQMLVVPLAIAFFGVAILLIRLVVM